MALMMSRPNPIESDFSTYLVAGSLARDKEGDEWRLGGSVAYCTLAARRMDVRTRVLTSHSHELAVGDLFREVEPIVSLSGSTTTFCNHEHGGMRTQELLEVGERLSAESIPESWTDPEILHLAPVFRELGHEFVDRFKPRLCGATVQGWLRQVNHQREIVFELHPEWESVVDAIDIAIFSDHDLMHNLKLRRHLCSSIPVCIETLGSRGCRVFDKGKEHLVGVESRDVGDTTGAGDVFATAFLVRYFRSGDPVLSARFANRFAAEMLADPDFRADLRPKEPGSV